MKRSNKLLHRKVILLRCVATGELVGYPSTYFMTAGVLY